MDSVAMSISFLKKLSPHVVGACRSLTCRLTTLLAGALELFNTCVAEPGSAMLEHFNHLRRQWASKAQKLLHSLRKITSADMDHVLGKF